MNFKQFLEEGRDAPLFHATSLDSLNQILKGNIVKAWTTQNINKKRIDGVSLTRDFRFAKNWAMKTPFKMARSCVIEFDQRKLSQRYKIVPFNYSLMSSGAAREMNNSEAEEFVIGPIKDPNKYINKIHFTDNIFYNTEASKEVLNHPKLFVDGKFINEL
jgi:hypothetical protein